MKPGNPLVSSKWISDLKPETPLVDAARRVLGLRLRTVGDMYGLATRKPSESIENIHQLRVAARRASAAIESFASCIPKKSYDQARKTLRRLRRRAGDAREWDIFLERLSRKGSASEATRILEGYGLAHRLPAHRKLVEACPDFPFDFERFVTETLAGLEDPSKSDSKNERVTFAEQAQITLVGLLGDLGNEMGKREKGYPQFHRVRIVGKRLRYAMEIFVDCFGEGFRLELYPQIEVMQEILGELNDHHNALMFYNGLQEEMPRVAPPFWGKISRYVRAALKTHQKGLVAGKKRYTEWKRQWKSARNRDLLQRLVFAKSYPIA